MGFVAPGKRFRRKRKGDRPPRLEASLKKEIAVPLDPLKVRRSRRSGEPVKSSESILERLPHDLLWEIFFLAGIDNNLPLASKYFHHELRAPRLREGDSEDVVQNKWLFLKVLRHCLVVNLNVNVEDGWAEKYEAALGKIESPSDLMKRITTSQLGVPNHIYHEKYAIDVNVFKLRFMNNTALEVLRESYPNIRAMSVEEIDVQIENRQACILWNYKVLQEALKQAEQVEEDANEYAVITDVGQKKTLKSLAPALDLRPVAKIPSSFYRKLDHSKALMIKNLIKHCLCRLENEVDFQKQCFDQLPFEHFYEYADVTLEGKSYSFDDFRLLTERIEKAEALENAEDNSLVELNLQLLYRLAEVVLTHCPIEDHERLRDLAWHTLRVQRSNLQQVLSTKSLESLQNT